MRLISLSLENFRQHKFTQIHFPMGLVGILGDNGSGKTTILEAIAWALYGKARGDNDSLIWRMAPGKAAAVVELVFAFNGQTIQVKRSLTMQKSTAEMRQNQKVIANSLKAVNEKILELLAMSRDEFFNSYFTGQKDLNFLGSIKGAMDRERFIAKMLGYEKITEVQGTTTKEGTIRYDLRQLENQVNRLEGALGNIEQVQLEISILSAELTSARATVELMNVNLDLAIAQKQQIELDLSKLELARDQYREFMSQQHTYYAQLERLSREIALKTNQCSQAHAAIAIYEALAQAVADYEALETELNRLAKIKEEFTKRAELEQRCQFLSQELQNLDQQIRVLPNQIAALANIETSIATLEIELERVNLAIKTDTQIWQNSQAELRAAIKTAEDTLEKLTHQQRVIVDAGAAGICPTCERPLESEFVHVVSGLMNQQERLRSDLENWHQALFNLKNPTTSSLHDLTQQLQSQLQKQRQAELKIRTDMGSIQLFQNQHHRLSQEYQNLQIQINQLPATFALESYQQLSLAVQTLKPKYTEYLRSQGVKQRWQELETEVTNLTEEQQQLQSQIQSLATEITSLNYQEVAYMQLKQALVTAQQQLETRRTELSQVQQHLALTDQALTTAQNQAQALREKQGAFRTAHNQKALVQSLDQAFTDLRQHLTAEIRPQLADAASIFLNQLTDGRYNALEIDEKYNVIVLSDGDRKPVISGGEEDIVNLCLRLAISQMITERSGQSFSLLILDEVFGSLDDNRRHNVLGLLNALEQQFEQVLVISHLDTIKDSLNHTIQLEFNTREQCSQVVP